MLNRNSKRHQIREIIQTYVPAKVKLFQKLVARARLKDLSRYDYLEKKVIDSKERETLTFRNKIVKECFEKWPAKANSIRELAQQKLPLGADYKGRKLESIVLDDVVFTFFALGFTPEEYIYNCFEKRTIDERLKFLSSRQKAKYHAHFDNLLESAAFSKWNTYLNFKEYFKRDVVRINKISDFPLFEAFVRKHSKYVKKDVDGMSGREVKLIDSATCGKSVRQQFDEMVTEQHYIVEELILQSKEMAQFNSSSVNTVRCITMNTKKGVQVPFGFLRVGTYGVFVDNAGSGGISCAIDMASGKLITDGYNERRYCFKAHPDTGIVFKGHQLPEWKQLLDLANKCASKLPGIKTIGWDIAHTDKGWVIVEGNAMSSIEVLQVSMQRGMRKDFEKYFREMEPIIRCNFE